MNENRSTFESRLCSAMKASGVTNADMSRITGFLPSNISHFTSGQRLPTLQSLQKILEALPHIDARWLITGVKK